MMGEIADYINTDCPEDDEFYEEQLIVELHYEKGMSVSAIAAKLNIPRSDVIAVLKWAKSF